jgi:uncharacterized protein (DUF1684 family)
MVGVLAYVFFQSPNQPPEQKLDTQTYIADVKRERTEKDLFFKADPESPLDSNQRTLFEQLQYYPINPQFRVEAKVQPVGRPDIITLSTSDGQVRQLQKWGYANFMLNGNQQQLLLLKSDEPGDNQLFIPFADATSARQTYGAGRYLDVPLPQGNTLLLDFNKAYNPYCAYSDKYSCPLPPPENMLGVPIQAGEKTYPLKQAKTP